MLTGRQLNHQFGLKQGFAMMRLYYCNNHIKKAFFDLDANPVSTDATNSAHDRLPYRVVGKHYIEIGEPISIGIVAEDTFGQLWLYPNDSRDGLSYINCSPEVLRDACSRWSSCRSAKEVREFQDWLHAEDVRSQFQPFAFWESLIDGALEQPSDKGSGRTRRCT